MSVYGENAPIKKQMDLEATIHYMLKANGERTSAKTLQIHTNGVF